MESREEPMAERRGFANYAPFKHLLSSSPFSFSSSFFLHPCISHTLSLSLSPFFRSLLFSSIQLLGIQIDSPEFALLLSTLLRFQTPFAVACSSSSASGSSSVSKLLCVELPPERSLHTSDKLCALKTVIFLSLRALLLSSSVPPSASRLSLRLVQLRLTLFPVAID